MLVEPGMGARARWKDSTPEERSEAARKMVAGRRAKPTPDINRAVEELIEEKAEALGRVRPSDKCMHNREYRHCTVGMCKVAAGLA